MIIVYCIDENYSEITALSIRSVRKFNPNAKIVVISESPISFFMDGVDKLIFHEMPKKMRSRGRGDRISKAAYLKFFLPVLPLEKIIYLDGDTICQGPLNELWDMPCEYINLCESHKFGKEQAKAIGSEKYGLTGMMVMNLKNLREIGFTGLCLDVEKNFPDPVTGWQHDETCINVAMKDKLTFINRKWNYCRNRQYDDPIPEAQAKILHYVGRQKNDMKNLPYYNTLEPIKDDIKGKRVAIVGNAKSLFDFKNGKLIDGFDFVIRFNRGFITRPECQGSKTDLLLLACGLTSDEIHGYNAKWVANRSDRYNNPVYFTIPNQDRRLIKEKLDCQPSTGFMAIDLCLASGAKSIDLFGFDFERTPTFYNSTDYKTLHDYSKEEKIVSEYERCGLLTINPKTEQQNDERN